MLEHPNLEGYYITTDGKVFSDWSTNPNRIRTDKLKQLKTYSQNNGYQRLVICGTNYLLHRLVLETYRPSNDPSLVVNHIDRDRTNNHLNNLEWVTQKQNIEHLSLIHI